MLKVLCRLLKRLPHHQLLRKSCRLQHLKKPHSLHLKRLHRLQHLKKSCRLLLFQMMQTHSSLLLKMLCRLLKRLHLHRLLKKPHNSQPLWKRLHSLQHLRKSCLLLLFQMMQTHSSLLQKKSCHLQHLLKRLHLPQLLKRLCHLQHIKKFHYLLLFQMMQVLCRLLKRLTHLQLLKKSCHLLLFQMIQTHSSLHPLQKKSCHLQHLHLKRLHRHQLLKKSCRLLR